VQLAFGRSFSPDEDKIGGAPSAVIGNRIAQERFGGGPLALGKIIDLNGVDYTVVGVLKPGFRFDENQAETLGKAQRVSYRELLCL
jgi:ABC-type antimicrobial peptide transport system permease subunit